MSEVKVDTISERTAAGGVTIDGVLLKDNVVNTDTVSEKTAASGVTIDGVLIKDSIVNTDNIAEKTATAGVTIDGVLIKDGVATFQTAAGSPLVFEGATANDHETTFAFTDPTADRIITFPDADVTIGGAYSPTPMWFAYANSDQTGVTDATWTKVTNLGAEAIDSDGAYATGTQTFTVPADKAGKYYIFGSVIPGSGATTTMNAGGAAIYVDAVKYADFVMDLQANPGFKIAAHVSVIIDLAVGEAVTIYGYGDMTSGSPAFYSSGFTKGGRFFGWRLSA
jgi:hypothetical protein